MKNARPVSALAASLIVLVALAAGCGGGGSDDVPADAVAVVDGTPITKTELDALIGRARASYKAQKREFPKAGTAEFQSLQSQGVAFLVQREEYQREAEELGVEVTDKQVEDRIVEVRQQYFGGNQKTLETQLKQQGYTPAAFRLDIESQLLSEGIAEKVTADVKVTDADVAKYYAANKSQYSVTESREVRHILVKTKAEADDVYRKLTGGASFAALAKQRSLDPGSKNSGGKLRISRGQTVAPFDKVSFSLGENELSKPVKTEFGFHVIQALGAVKQGSTTPLEDVSKQIRTQLLQEKKDKLVTTWAEDARKRYEDKVEYATGFAPPATSETTADTETNGDG